MTAEQAVAYLEETYGIDAARPIEGAGDRTTTLGGLLGHAFRIGVEANGGGRMPTASSVGARLLAQIVPAQPGWRLAVLGPDEDLEACPIVAWAVANAGTVVGELGLEPIARWHGQDGYAGASLNAGKTDRVVGILAPGDELNEGWINAGREIADALRENPDA